MKGRSHLFLIGLLLAFTSSAQVRDYAFRRKLNPIDSAGWYRIALPDELFIKINPQFSDLRIYQINGKDTVETPYIINIRQQQTTNETIELEALNQSRREDSQYFTFEIPSTFKVNYLELIFTEKNFDGFAKLQGSNDQKEWFEIDDRQRIISIDNQNVQFNSSVIRSKPQNFKFLRLEVKADKLLTLEKAMFKKTVIEKGVLKNTKLKWREDPNKKTKQSMISLDLKDYVPVVKLMVETNEEKDYYRSFRLEQLSDSSLSPKGYQYNYKTVMQGYLTSLDSNQFNFDFVLARKFKLIIDNADNSPLKIKNITLTSPTVELLTRLTTGSSYLYYGNGHASSPSYDLVHFKEKFPAFAPALTLDQEEKLTIESERVSPLMEKKIWLWFVMVIIIAVLGLFTVKMMKGK